MLKKNKKFLTIAIIGLFLAIQMSFGSSLSIQRTNASVALEPINVSVTYNDLTNSVLISWLNPNVNSLAYAHIYRSEVKGQISSEISKVTLGMQNAGQTSIFLDTTIVKSKTYYYTVRLETVGGTISTNTDQATVVIPADTQSKTDLVVNDIIYSDNSFYVKYCNQGQGTSNVKFAIKLSSSKCSNCNIIIGGDSTRYTVPLLGECAISEAVGKNWFGVGTSNYVEMTIIVDSGGQIDESNENNNTLVKTVVIGGTQGKPDLTFSNLTMDPTNPVVGQKVKFTYTVKNIGTAISPGYYPLWTGNAGVYAGTSEDTSSNCTWSGLNPSESGSCVEFRRYDNPGTFIVSWKIDPNNEIDESNENNNTLEKTIIVAGVSTDTSSNSNENTSIPEKKELAKTLKNGTLAKAKGAPGVYLISNDTKRPIKSAKIFVALGYDWDDIIEVDESILNAYSLGSDVTVSK